MLQLTIRYQVLRMSSKTKRSGKLIEFIAGIVIDKVLGEIDDLFSNPNLEDKVKKMVAA